MTMTGLLMIAAQCTVSGMASVYAEYILKKQQEVTYFNTCTCILTMSIHCLMFAVLLVIFFFWLKKPKYYVIDIISNVLI